MNDREAETLPPPAIDELTSRLDEARAALARLQKRRAEADHEHNLLTNLFVITRGLHESVDSATVSEVVRDVIVNFIGCEEVAFYERASDPEVAYQRAWEVGVAGLAPPKLTHGSDLARALSRTEPFVLPSDALPSRRPTDPSAVIPLVVDGAHLGSVVLFALLPQRPHYERLDQDIIGLLSIHGANALYAALLHARYGESFRAGGGS